MEVYVILHLTMLSSVFFMSAAGAAVPLSDEYALEVIEGDILVTPEELAAIDQAENEESRNGLIDVATRWPNKTVVYYIKKNQYEQVVDGLCWLFGYVCARREQPEVICLRDSPGWWHARHNVNCTILYDIDEEQIRKLHTAMRDIENHTCIKFREKQNKNEHVVFISDRGLGCGSQIGFKYNWPFQSMNLGKHCFEHGTMLHELLHTIGFDHMHNTYNRDDFITINWDNIKDEVKMDFNKKNETVVTDFGVPYDYGSVMHYPKDRFSKNGEDTIVPKQDVFIGQRIGLSPSDILKVNKMYDCP